MSLYDRNIANSYENERYAESSRSAFIKQTYQLFAASLLAASAGAYIGTGFAGALAGGGYWILVIAELALLFGLQAAKRKSPLNLILLFAFTFVSGLTLAPIIAITMASASGGIIVAQAFTLTTVAFGGLSFFAMNTKRDFSAMGKMLFIAVIILVVASLINLFFHSSTASLVISSIGAFVFSAFILYDTQNIIKGAYETPIEGAVALYLDFVNLFVSLLQILRAFSGNRD